MRSRTFRERIQTRDINESRYTGRVSSRIGTHVTKSISMACVMEKARGVICFRDGSHPVRTRDRARWTGFPCDGVHWWSEACYLRRLVWKKM